MADIPTGQSNLLLTPPHTNASAAVAESLAISEPLDEPDGDSSFPSEPGVMHASKHSSGTFFAATPDPAHAHAPALAPVNAAPVIISVAPPVESLTGSRSHNNNGSHSPLHMDSLQDKKTFFERRPSQTKHRRLSILQSASSTIGTNITTTTLPLTTTTTVAATATTLESNREDAQNLPLTPLTAPNSAISSPSSSSPFLSSTSLSSSSSTSLPISSVAQNTNTRSSNSSLPHRQTDTTPNTTATTTTATHSHLLPILAFDLPLSPPSQSFTTESYRSKEDLGPINSSQSAAAIVQTAQEELSNSQVPAEQPHILQRNINHNKTMSASPVLTPMTTPNMSGGGGHANMFNSNGNNSNELHLRSPSLSSGTGSGHGQTTTNSTSSSSATTTITTTHSSPLNGTSGMAMGTPTGATATTGMATGTTTGLGLGSSSVSDIKLKRFLEHNQRLKEQLEMRRISVSEASQSLIKFVTSTKDTLLPSLWGQAASDPFSKQSSGCCTIS